MVLADSTLRVASVIVGFGIVGLQFYHLVVGIYRCFPIIFFTIEIAGGEPCSRLELAVHSLHDISDGTPFFDSLFNVSLLLK